MSTTFRISKKQSNWLECIVEFLIVIGIAYAIASVFAYDVAISLGSNETIAFIIKWACFFFVILIYYRLVKVTIQVSRKK